MKKQKINLVTAFHMTLVSMYIGHLYKTFSYSAAIYKALRKTKDMQGMFR